MEDSGIYFLFENHPEFWTVLLCSFTIMVFFLVNFAKLYMLCSDSEYLCDRISSSDKYDERAREKYIKGFKLKYALIASVSAAVAVLFYLEALGEL